MKGEINRRVSGSLNQQIHELEQKIVSRQTLIAAHAGAIRQHLVATLSSPFTLLTAAGAGFAVGYFKLFSRPAPAKTNDNGEKYKRSGLVKVLNAISLTGSIVAMLPKTDAQKKPDF